MKTKITFLLVLLLVPALPYNSLAIGVDDVQGLPPAPVFQSLNVTGVNNDGSYIYKNNTVVSIKYKADRYDVNGLVLLGKGSNLTTDLGNTAFHLNFSKVSSLRGDSFYEVSLNITSYTYFYAYSWSGSMTNRTMEKLDLLGNAPGHELWIQEGKLYPSLSDTTHTKERDDGLYLPLYHNTTITYQVRNSDNDTSDFVVLAMAENETAVYDTSATQVNMTRTNYTKIENSPYFFSIFKFELNLTSPVLYFTAYNNHGWEHSSVNKGIVHRIYNGFSFNQTFSDNLDLYTPSDPVSFNITTYNQTDDMSVGYKYRYFANQSSDDPLKNWTIVDALTNTTSDEYLNSTEGGHLEVNSTRKSTYGATLSETFEAKNLIELQTFVRYGSASNITSNTYKIVIIDPYPIITVTSANETISRRTNATIIFEVTTPKGEISSFDLTQVMPNNVTKQVFDIKGRSNQTVEFQVNSGNTTILEGNHTLILNATNSLNKSSIVTIIYSIDLTSPNGTLTRVFPSSETTTTGLVKYSFTFEDQGVFQSGIQIATLDWGNNITMNVTSLSQASMTYRHSGTYTLTLTILDKVGNEYSITSTIIVSLPKSTTTNTGNSPLPVLPSILVLLSSSLVLSAVRRRKVQSIT